MKGFNLLVLDEKKIRKGRAIGLPYQGSKKRISKKIVEIIKQNFGTDKTVYDIFGGGGAITAECVLNDLKVCYNDIDSNMTNIIKMVIEKDKEWIKGLVVSREDFFKIMKKNRSSYEELVLIANSFSYARQGYIYSSTKSKVKFELVLDIIYNHDTFRDYKKTDTYISRLEELKGVEREGSSCGLEHMSALGQIEAFQNLKKLKDVQYTNASYESFSDLKNCIVYLDPPYDNSYTKGYKNCESFDSVEFYDWAVEMSKSNIVLLSGYEVSDVRFEEVFEFKGIKSNLNGGNFKNGYDFKKKERFKKSRTEKLFMVKG